MKKLYLVLSQTKSFPSRLISFFTKEDYAHVSLSLNRDLTEMYTFGRKYLYSVFPGGYVKECIHERMYKRFPNTHITVIEIVVENSVYENISQYLRDMYENKKKYKYNYLGVFLAYFQKNKKRENYYYCSEFIYEILCKFGVIVDGEPHRVVRPSDFLEFPLGEFVYVGYMRTYK